jgi:hypothetical protein
MLRVNIKKLQKYVHKIMDVGPTVSNPPHYHQEHAPEHGFAPIRIRKNTQRRKFWHPYTLTVVALMIIAYGWYKYRNFNIYKRALLFEQKVMETAITPFLVAEHDIM